MSDIIVDNPNIKMKCEDCKFCSFSRGKLNDDSISKTLFCCRFPPSCLYDSERDSLLMIVTYFGYLCGEFIKK